ncbi:MAG: hypothetical protein QOD87_1090, partial [Pseudonocardiales bacterium]|nr:hypothetical protein [Pseudonocardiales bacterium]
AASSGLSADAIRVTSFTLVMDLNR